jgi:hypothetical protein
MAKRTEGQSILDRYFALSELPNVEVSFGKEVTAADLSRSSNSRSMLSPTTEDSPTSGFNHTDLALAAGYFESINSAAGNTGPQVLSGESSGGVENYSGPLLAFTGGGNLFRPRINGLDKTLQIGTRTSVSNLFEYLDLDGNPIHQISVLDTTQSRTSGFWRFGRSRLDSGQWHTFSAADMRKLKFQSGLIVGIDKVQIRVQDSDGVTQRWSLVDTIDITTVDQNNRPPVASVDNIQGLASETYALAGRISGTDPDGYDILKYKVKYVGAGTLEFKGQAVAKKKWITVRANELDELLFHTKNEAVKSRTTKLAVRAYDGSAWSLVDKGKIIAAPNQAAPITQANDRNVARNEQLQAHTLFSPSDADGNTIKEIAFYDTGVEPDGGYFSVGGVQQSARQWFVVSADDLSTVRYNAAAILDFEDFRVKVFDGMYWSDFKTATISTVNKPVIDVEDVTVVGELEEVQVSSLFTQTDVEPTLTGYEVIDLNSAPLSGSFQLNGVDLSAGEVHYIDAANLGNLTFVGGSIDNRYSDEIMIRATNSEHWSDWSRGSVNTEPNMVEALNQLGTWNNVPGSPVEVTFSFAQIVPNYYAADAQERTAFQPFNGLMRAAAREMLTKWSQVSGITFREVSDAVGGVIRMGLADLGDDGILGWAYPPNGVLTPNGVAGDIWINVASVLAGTSEDPLINQDPGSEGFFTLIHEGGHAIGHSHPFDAPIRLPSNTDSQDFTVMSYRRRASGLGPSAPMLYDVAANQVIYGANFDYNSGDTVYDFPTDVPIAEAVWDGGGIDTFDFSAHSRNISIDLRSGQFSSYGDEADNLNIAYNATIENVVGGTGDDEFHGNHQDNILEGKVGDDEFHGLGGNDLMSGEEGDDRYFVGIGDGHDTIEERDGGGWDRLRIDLTGVDLGFGAGDEAFTEHIAARKVAGDLHISMSTRGETAYGSIVIKNFESELSRVETLQIYEGNSPVTRDIDLTSVYVQAGDEYSRFTISDFSTEYGQVALPS